MNASQAAEAAKKAVDSFTSRFKTAKVTVFLHGEEEHLTKWNVEISMYIANGVPVFPCGCEGDSEDVPETNLQ